VAIALALAAGDAAAAPDTTRAEEPGGIVASYGARGFELATRDGRFKMQIQPRLQFRFSTPLDADPATPDDLEAPAQPTFKVNRARLKIGGNAFQPWLQYYWEYELAQNALLDFRLQLARWPGLRLRLGQWKADYGRERLISSGAQEMADRSLINRPFMVDRQQGVALYGHLAGLGAANFEYWAEVLTGTGRGNRTNDDATLMYLGRAQWNCFGRQVPWEGSDTRRHEEPVGLVAVAAVTNRSPYTAFSQLGGGSLEGFSIGEPGQYRVNQALVETAFQYRGLAWQQELHWKQIDDRDSSAITTLTGNYVQLGYFFHGLAAWVPKPLELASRYALYDPNRDQDDDLQQELSFAGNWFFDGHRNKLTAETAVLRYEQAPPAGSASRVRFRLQWDISF
jgi:phosphate-selective porin